ncbi:MAG TPA: bifunctional DNA-formamidopyrimidine glycosylase/DNA-(apurinic or apyrimidinic site) lyase [Herpetosiphonaceae bacterium]|nr:bifunctional DNA-formamidopyrimidine glycosylase/DNA-(apurinic or apyrimidinic site) lyase [Herpetosiphonaceae bacterium]
MPELPEVETVRRTLEAALVGRRIVEPARVTWPRTIAEPAPELFCELLCDRPVTAVERRAKYLIIRLDRGEALVVHLRMTGRLVLHAEADEPDAHTHVVLRLDDGRQLFFRDTRKFGRIWLLDSAGLDLLDGRLGVEPLHAALTAEEFRTLLRRRKGRLKPLLLDQKLIAGLGNIYVDEALWAARLHPLQTVPPLADEEIDRLYAAIRSVLAAAIERRGTSFSDYRDGWGEQGDNQNFLQVYGRAGQPCHRCGTPIERTVIGQRGTHFCPGCQATTNDERRTMPDA